MSGEPGVFPRCSGTPVPTTPPDPSGKPPPRTGSSHPAAPTAGRSASRRRRSVSCAAPRVEWVELPGTGTVYSFTVVRHPLARMLNEVVPYASGIIELDGTQGAGARMIANIVECHVDALRSVTASRSCGNT